MKVGLLHHVSTGVLLSALGEKSRRACTGQAPTHCCHCYPIPTPEPLHRGLFLKPYGEAHAVGGAVMLLQEHDQDAFKHWVLPKLETMYVTTVHPQASASQRGLPH